MRITILLGAAAAIGLIATDPAFCMQEAPPPTEQMPLADPANPVPMPDPAQPAPPLIEPLPPEMPVPAGEAQPVRVNTDAPVGPMATPPAAAAPSAQSGGTTSSMMQPVAATKEYPPCSKTLQDNCRNPGEGPKATRKRR
jgi:hypothetical protein